MTAKEAIEFIRDWIRTHRANLSSGVRPSQESVAEIGAKLDAIEAEAPHAAANVAECRAALVNAGVSISAMDQFGARLESLAKLPVHNPDAEAHELSVPSVLGTSARPDEFTITTDDVGTLDLGAGEPADGIEPPCNLDNAPRYPAGEKSLKARVEALEAKYSDADGSDSVSVADFRALCAYVLHLGEATIR